MTFLKGYLARVWHFPIQVFTVLLAGYHLLFPTYLGLQPRSWLSCPNILRQLESKSLIDTGLPSLPLGMRELACVDLFTNTEISDLKDVTQYIFPGSHSVINRHAYI